ncbi:MAG TPA: trypsin-like peptidase domain-containing protein, partial [Ignavibacteriaceae bacterium]|nr:trypsin-like peptidase domain-containing protein [Ignavibacteriaceae bacterium]
MKTKGILGAVALVVVGILFGALLVSGFGLVRPGWADINLGANQPPVNLDADATSFSKAFIEVAEKVTPAIVQINVVSERENPHKDFFFFPFDNQIPKEQQGSGSGIIISDDGYILTNNHVVENATKVSVGLADKRTFSAKVVGTDPLTDLAVVKIDAEKLTSAYLGDSDNLKVGQWVMAIGNPLSLSSTVTAGIVSAIGRGQLGLINDSYGVEDFIQTDAVINPGNSGGALVDLSGAVVGINSAIATRGTGTYIGYGFAIPINLAKTVAKEIIAYGKVNRGYIGINIGEVNDALAKSMGLDKPKGIIIQGIVEGGAASETDLKSGDIILSVDGRELYKPNELQGYIASKTAGTAVNLKIFRDGKELDRKVTLKARDEDTKNQPVKMKSEDNSKSETKSNTVSFES